MLTKTAAELEEMMQTMKQNCPPQGKQEVIDKMTQAVADSMHKAYRESIGMVKVRDKGKTPFWVPSLKAMSKAQKRIRANIKYQQNKGNGSMPIGSMHSKWRPKKKEIRRILRTLRGEELHKRMTKAIDEGNGSQEAWKLASSLKKSKAVSGLGNQCTWKGEQYKGTQVGEAISNRMKAIHTFDGNDPQYDQEFHDRVAKTIPSIMEEEEESPLNEPF